MVAGIDIDPACAFPFESNIEAPFIEMDVRNLTAAHLEPLWSEGSIRLLAGCAPCQPFSPYRRGIDTSKEAQWPLLREFARLVEEVRPELVTMENVARIGTSAIFAEFVDDLKGLGYEVSWQSCYGPRFGLPQHRRRLVLIASLVGRIEVPNGDLEQGSYRTVRDAIGSLPALESGGKDANDRLHVARRLSPINMQRIAASVPGGTWEDWPEELRADCHRRATGASFKNVYARMEWDQPSPTITTLAHNFGAGRFGHPEQDRPISLREAALLQGFPRDYKLVSDARRVSAAEIGRLIGNAVPPPIAKAVGETILSNVNGVPV